MMHRRPLRAWLCGLLLLIGSAAVVQSQRWVRVEPNVPYDGRFAFVRLRYIEYGPPGWSYDYPAMERNFMTIVQDLTTMRVHARGSNVHDMDDPQLSRYPIAYLSEPGYWRPTDKEAAGLRTWLQKGGFLIVDDFYFRQWENFVFSMRQVLPDAQFIRLEASHPIFDAFFRIPSLDGMTHPDNRSARAEYYGIFEDNDPAKRMLAIVNYNNDIGDYMEWSGQGWYAVNLTNDAYKFATNYLVYALTH
ncbi:MAG TPA: DUF4159 domain-containing protein [Gemmatimonas aurantiaca]|nr:DUF4159 domain-containing protein [Gemmatimonas aurantiaca]HCT57424.1 DUF4159 domain-containing protein [Gemmatimonas aurantiaca]